MVAVGEPVRVVDENRKEHIGLVTAIHGFTTLEQRTEFCDAQIASLKGRDNSEDSIAYYECLKDAEEFSPSSINVLYVSSDPSKRDPYGQQVERLSSLSHKSQQQGMTVPGRYYELLD